MARWGQPGGERAFAPTRDEVSGSACAAVAASARGEGVTPSRSCHPSEGSVADSTATGSPVARLAWDPRGGER